MRVHKQHFFSTTKKMRKKKKKNNYITMTVWREQFSPTFSDIFSSFSPPICQPCVLLCVCVPFRCIVCKTPHIPHNRQPSLYSDFFPIFTIRGWYVYVRHIHHYFFFLFVDSYITAVSSISSQCCCLPPFKYFEPPFKVTKHNGWLKIILPKKNLLF